MKKVFIVIGMMLLLAGCKEEVPEIDLVLRGSEEMVIDYGKEFVEPGAELSNAPEGTQISRTGSLNPQVSGEYIFVYEAVVDGVSYTATRKVTVEEPTDVEFYLKGKEYTVHEIGTDYTDAGIYLSILSLEVNVTDNLDLLTTGTYQLNYHITVNEEVFTLTRNIIVVDPTVFNFFLLGEDTVEVEKDTVYVDDGFYIGDTSLSVTQNSTVDTSIAGSYVVTYSVLNEETLEVITRTVTVIEN